jgi:hypothetical protein
MEVRGFARVALITSVVLSLAGCLCSREPTDEERLMKQIESTKVHVYVALKVALAGGADDQATRDARQKARALVEKLGQARRGDGEAGSVGLGDAVDLGKALWELRQTGARIVRGEGEESGTVIPAVLAEAGARPELVAAIDANGEHALFLIVMSVLKVHPRSPIPIPAEILLYEAWKTDPSKVKIPGMVAPLHAVKAWVYGTNGYCDLARTESGAAEKAGLDPAQLKKGLELIGFPDDGAGGDLSWVEAAVEMVSHGATAICNLKRGDDTEARAAVRRFVASAREAGLDGEELEYLETYVECGDGQVAAGRARLDKMLAARGGQLAEHEDLQLLGAYCDAAGSTSNETLRKVVLASKLAGLAVEKARRAGAVEELEQTDVYRAVEGVAAAGEAMDEAGDLLPGSVDQAKQQAGDLLDKLKRSAEGAGEQ